MKYWLMKSEPDVYGIDHLRAENRKTDHWDGIRNYQARNFMRDEMEKGDLAFFYHSNCEEPAIVGVIDPNWSLVRETSLATPSIQRKIMQPLIVHSDAVIPPKTS